MHFEIFIGKLLHVYSKVLIPPLSGIAYQSSVDWSQRSMLRSLRFNAIESDTVDIEAARLVAFAFRLSITDLMSST